MIEYLAPALVAIATAAAAYTDYKTGYIYDHITYPLIAIGVILRLWSQDWMGLGLGIAVFAVLYAFYWTGKLGGGDVKLFTGMALVLPFYQKQIFLLNVLFFAALLALLFYALYYLYKLWKDKIPIKTEGQQRNTAILLAIFALVFSGLLVYNNTVSVWVG
ncbi:MAG: A24 family peptidase, partial [Candidatus Diapherotrites archaeon]|nr:A24 family peptidase [Candidatus Diapherotrites archaeon]